MITIDILEQSGYKKHYDHLYASSFWQKRIWDVNGTTTLYFINLYRNTHIKNGYQWELKLAFDSKSKFADYCWLSYNIPMNATIKDIETGAEECWRMHQGIAYEVRH